MPRVIFKDKNVVYLGLSPDHAVEAEEEEMKDNKKVTAIYLLQSVTQFICDDVAILLRGDTDLK
jgi:hypothetical protein